MARRTCANCHCEVRAALQLLRETAVETPGEFREACPDRADACRNGDPERSLPKGRCVGRNVQRLEAEEPCPITPHERPAPSPKTWVGEEIVQARQKCRGTCNRRAGGSSPPRGAKSRGTGGVRPSVLVWQARTQANTKNEGLTPKCAAAREVVLSVGAGRAIIHVCCLEEASPW